MKNRARFPGKTPWNMEFRGVFADAVRGNCEWSANVARGRAEACLAWTVMSETIGMVDEGAATHPRPGGMHVLDP